MYRVYFMRVIVVVVAPLSKISRFYFLSLPCRLHSFGRLRRVAGSVVPATEGATGT